MSLRVELRDVGKRYRLEWVLKQVNLTLEPGSRYALTGPNGSGKSTLMRLISGHLSPSRGSVHFSMDNKPVSSSDIYHHLAFAAPYIELIEEFSLEEAIHFHQRFKPLAGGLSADDLIGLLDFRRARTKQIRHFSSGMKQRLKLALALTSQAPLLLLDEPTTNLDRQGVDWYLRLIERFGAGRLIIVASNVPVDYQFCEREVSILDFKG